MEFSRPATNAFFLRIGKCGVSGWQWRCLLPRRFSPASIWHGYYPLLPEKIASHFDAQGIPNDWTTKQQFVWLAGGTFAGLTLLLCAMPIIVRIAPPSLINLPNKDYWLGPEQRDATFQFLTTWMLWFAACTLWLLAIVLHAAMVANLQRPPQLMPMWWLLGGFLAAVMALLFVLMRRFRRTERGRLMIRLRRLTVLTIHAARSDYLAEIASDARNR